MINFGKFDREIVIQSATETRDSYADVVLTWTTFATLWAQEISVGASEQFRMAAEHSARMSRFRIRYYPGITSKMRISYAGSYWKIQGIIEIGRQEALDLLAEEFE